VNHQQRILFKAIPPAGIPLPPKKQNRENELQQLNKVIEEEE
jgi:hypothetical protein